jgi:hypothetical protein
MSEHDELIVTGKQATESLARIRKDIGRVTLDESRIFVIVEWWIRNVDKIAELTAENKRLKDRIRERVGVLRAPYKPASRTEAAINLTMLKNAEELEKILEPKE